MKRQIMSAFALFSTFLLMAGIGLADTSDTHTTALDVGNVAPVVNYVAKMSPATVNPTEGGTTATYWEVHVYDENGAGDVASVTLALTKGGQSTRSALTCTDIGDINPTTANFTCTVNMMYYDGAGADWAVNATGYDVGALLNSNTSATMTYGSLTAWTMTPTAINFGTLTLGDTNAKATDDPIYMNNTGNEAQTTIEITAKSLVGLVYADVFNANLFKVGIADDCAGTSLVHNVATPITSATLPVSSTNREELYYCIPTVPGTGLSADTYDTTTNGVWTIATSA